MFSDSVDEIVSSDSSNEDRDFSELCFNQSLNFNSKSQFLNSKFKSISENLRVLREKTFNLSKNINDSVPHKFSIDNILGQLNGNEVERENDDSNAEKEECRKYELSEDSRKLVENRDNGM